MTDAFNALPPDPAQTWIEIGGKRYGARADGRGPLGGGAGYGAVVRTCGNTRVYDNAYSTADVVE